MVTVRFGRADLTNVRFAISPLFELHQSVRALADPDARALHDPWITATRQRIPARDLELLRALLPPGAYAPDFIHPPPSTPHSELADELDLMVMTPGECVRAEVEHAYCGAPIPEVLRPFIDSPKAAVERLADVLRSYWDRVLEPHWPRLRALLEGDVLYRARQLADGGAQLVFADLHDNVRFADYALWIDKDCDETLTLDGHGLLFVPTAFGWPRLRTITKAPWQPTVIYPARGIGALWEPTDGGAPAALAAALGTRRAAVLASLDVPRSTTELATRMGLPASSVSQHLVVLRDVGLVRAHRIGRVVLYVRSPLGESLTRQG